MNNISCENCVHADYCINNRNIEPNHRNCGIDYGYAFDHEKYDCGDCQREDAPCEYCIRSEENTDKTDPDLEDLYFHKEVSNE